MQSQPFKGYLVSIDISGDNWGAETGLYDILGWHHLTLKFSDSQVHTINLPMVMVYFQQLSTII